MGEPPVARVKEEAPTRQAETPAPIVDRERIVVLSTGSGLWNTGVWPGWGNGPRAELQWAAAGVIVEKTCQYRCRFTHDQSFIEQASGYVWSRFHRLMQSSWS